MLKKTTSGFSLVEVLVASFMIAIVVVAVTRLSASAEKFTGVGRETFVATNLAREGLELIRAMRDTNWFTSTDRTLWLEHGLCSVNGEEFADSNRQLAVDAKSVRAIDTLDSGSGQLYIDPQNHEWTLASSQQVTPYARTIDIDCSTKDNDPPLITVTARVNWNSRGVDREVSVTEQLYNWLPEQRKINP